MSAKLTTAGSTDEALVLGMSHILSVQRAAKQHANTGVQFVALNDRKDVWEQRHKSEVHFDRIEGPQPSQVFLSIGGNTHAVVGLIENPQPLAVVSADGTYRYDIDERTAVPRSIMKRYFHNVLKQQLDFLVAAKSHYVDAEVHHLCSPPPVKDASHIENYPGIFEDQLHRGIAPADLRLTLYQIHTEVWEEACHEANVNFIAPPEEAIDPDGFLRSDYTSPDPTHGNTDYGTLVLNQINTISGQER